MTRTIALAALLALSLPARATNYLVLVLDDVGVDKISAYEAD